MATKRNNYGRFEVSMNEAEAMKITESQCHDCTNREGFDGCKVYGKAPDKYVFVSANVPCPDREVQNAK